MKIGYCRFGRSCAALAAGVVLAGGACSRQAGPSRLDYPQAKKVDQVDTYHGVRVADP